MKQQQQHALIAEALHWLVRHQPEQPGLKQLSARFGLSESHMQRSFQEFTGVSPKQFLKFLTKEQALERLNKGQNVFDASLDCGLSGPGRLHDLLVTTEAMSPGEARRAGHGLTIEYGFGMTPFGDCVVAWTPRGLCFLGFCENKSHEQAVHEISRQWPAAKLTLRPRLAAQHLQEVFAGSTDAPLRVWLHGSPFQLRVWQALLEIPAGANCTYAQIASHLGQPRAARAVGSAVGSNPVSWLIPCHRVITSLAKPGGYRWGIDTKLAIIGYEAARASA